MLHHDYTWRRMHLRLIHLRIICVATTSICSIRSGHYIGKNNSCWVIAAYPPTVLQLDIGEYSEASTGLVKHVCFPRTFRAHVSDTQYRNATSDCAPCAIAPPAPSRRPHDTNFHASAQPDEQQHTSVASTEHIDTVNGGAKAEVSFLPERVDVALAASLGRGHDADVSPHHAKAGAPRAAADGGVREPARACGVQRRVLPGGRAGDL